MAAGTVVVNFNIFKHRVAHLFASGKPFTVDGLHLQAVKEAFSADIVVAVALGAHVADQLVCRHEILVCARTILACRDLMLNWSGFVRHPEG